MDPRFAELSPADQISAADRFFAESVKDKVDPSSDRYMNLKTEFRRRIMPDLKVGQGEVPQMSKAEQFWAGLKGGTEDLGLGAVQAANDAVSTVRGLAKPASFGDEDITKYYQSDLKRDPTPEEVTSFKKAMAAGASPEDAQIDLIASGDEAVGFQQTPEQKAETLRWLREKKDQTKKVFGQAVGRPYNSKNDFASDLLINIGGSLESGMSPEDVLASPDIAEQAALAKKFPFGTPERGKQLKQEAAQMAVRKKPLYDTMAGTIGQVAPAMLLPGSTIPKAIKSGLAYGAAQPVTDEGQRTKNTLGSGVAFGAGSALGGVAAKGIERVISPVRGGRPSTEAQRQLTKRADEAEEQGFNVTVGQRTGSNRIQTAESVIERTPLVGAKISRINEQNAIRANQILGEQFGVKADALTDDVLRKARDDIGSQFTSLVKDKTPINYDKRFLVEGRKLKKEVELLDEELRNPVLVKAVDLPPVATSKSSTCGRVKFPHP